MNFNIIGAGRLGKNIALALSAAQLAELLCICNQDLASTEQSLKHLGFGSPAATIADLPKADITWITSGDDAIQSIVTELMQNPNIKAGSFIIHCSGVLNSSLLAPLKQKGCFVASLHPLKAFRSDYLQAQAFNKVVCVLEGDDPVCNWLKPSFERLGAHIITIKPEAKTSYHAAACIAANYLVTLAHCSEELFVQSGIDAEQAREITASLMQSSLDNIQNADSTAQALTGPLMRGDLQTLGLHLQALENPVIKNLYQTLGLATLDLVSLSEEKMRALKALMNQ